MAEEIEPASPLEKLACHWTTILDVEVTSDQVDKMLAAVPLVAPSPCALVIERGTARFEKFYKVTV